MQVEKEKSPRFFSNLNFAKIFYLPPISCRREFGEIFLFKHRQVRCKKQHILPPQAATSSGFICFADYAVTSRRPSGATRKGEARSEPKCCEAPRPFQKWLKFLLCKYK